MPRKSPSPTLACRAQRPQEESGLGGEHSRGRRKASWEGGVLATEGPHPGAWPGQEGPARWVHTVCSSEAGASGWPRGRRGLSPLWGLAPPASPAPAGPLQIRACWAPQAVPVTPVDRVAPEPPRGLAGERVSVAQEPAGPSLTPPGPGWGHPRDPFRQPGLPGVLTSQRAGPRSLAPWPAGTDFDTEDTGLEGGGWQVDGRVSRALSQHQPCSSEAGAPHVPLQGQRQGLA